MYYTQNNEEQIILDYFKDEKNLSVLDIGANDGKTFSNSLRLIELGWSAVLIEPSPKAFSRLSKLHINNSKVTCLPIAISNSNGIVKLKESSGLIGQGDVGLVSSLKEEENYRWIREFNVSFTNVDVLCMDFNSFYHISPIKKFEFISIDTEGFDLEILQQIDLDLIGCKCLCIEFNGKQKELFQKYMSKYSLNLFYENKENLIFKK
jgi:FkbM family methyltransferase